MMLYEITVHTTSGSEDVMGNYLPIILNQFMKNRLLSLRSNSIGSWEDLKRAFVTNYMAM